MFCVSGGIVVGTKAQSPDLSPWLCPSEPWGHRVFAAGVALDISASEFGLSVLL